jgi:hypothetical protein
LLFHQIELLPGKTRNQTSVRQDGAEAIETNAIVNAHRFQSLFLDEFTNTGNNPTVRKPIIFISYKIFGINPHNNNAKMKY